MIAEELQKNGKKVICVDEDVQEHPSDYANYDFSDFRTERKTFLYRFSENFLKVKCRLVGKSVLT